MKGYTKEQTLGVKCSPEELQKVVESVIENKMNDLFSFNNLVERVYAQLDELYLFEKEPNTIYEGGYKLSILDIDLVQKTVWNMIWDRKLMLDLHNDKYRYTPDRTSMRLIKVK